MDIKTLQYYENNANQYFDSTVTTDVSHLYSIIEKQLDVNASILDVGCGSGRDLKHFKDSGYDAIGIDFSKELCNLAEKYSKAKVYYHDFVTWVPENGVTFDAIWANASLLHLKVEELSCFLKNTKSYLKDKAYIFCSFKNNISAGYDEKGRFFEAFDDATFTRLISSIGDYQIVEKTSSDDSMGRDGIVWVNYLIEYKRNNI